MRGVGKAQGARACPHVPVSGLSWALAMWVGQHLELYCRKVYECAMGLQAEVLQVASKTKALDTLLGQTLAVPIGELLVC